MKKFIFSLILGFALLMSFTSCASPAYAQGEIYDDVSIVVRYGTPYYYNGSLLYYMYNGYYYYPYLRNNHYYYHRYSRPRPLPPPRGGRHFEPRHYDRSHVGKGASMRSSTHVGHQRGSSNFSIKRHFGGRR